MSRPNSGLVRFGAMVSDAGSTLPRAICTLRSRTFHVPRSFLLCVLSLWLTLSAAQALDPSKRLTQYAHTAWRIQDGFLPNTPFWISQSKEGYLWVGGKRGVWRFDGIRFTPWSPPIAATRIRKLVSVRVGEFWIGTQNELVHVRDNVVISHYDLPVITGIHEDSDGSVWALSLGSTDRILCHATDTSIRCFGKAEGITFHNPLPIIPDGKGGFWIGGDTSLLHWKMGAAPEVYSPQQLRSNVGQVGIHCLVKDSDGSLWVGIEGTGPGLGLERFRDGVFTPVVLPNFDGSKLNIEAMIEDSDKNLWIATYGNGIYRIHGQTVDHFGRADGLSGDAVFDLYEGRDGIVWAATSNGIDNFRELPVTTFSTSEGLGRDGANSVMATKDGTVWVGNLGTLDFIRNGAVSSVRVPGEQVSSLLEDHRGNIWVGVDDGLFLYKNGRFRRITGPDHHPLGMVLGITEDADGNMWAQCKGTQRRLIRIQDFKVREEFPEPPVPPANAIAADPKGGIWLGALTGDLTFFRKGIARTFPLNLKGSWAEKTAHQITVDPDGTVITASDNGLVMLRAGKVQRLGKENGLPCDGVTGFVVDDNRNLWLNTPCGFIEVAASDVQRWWIHPDTIVQARVFDALDGALPGPVTFNPAAKSLDGRLWFVNNVVLQMIDPSHLSGDGTASPVYVETVVADRKQYNPQEGLHLPPLTRDLQIGYTSPSFLIPQKVKFRYRLDGHDRDWQEAGTRREAFYTQLGPGKYRFRVIACNNNGVWNEAGAVLDFTIAPAFYQTAWFRALGVVLFLIVLLGIFRLRLRHLERQRDALRKSEKELRAVIDTIPATVWTTRPDGSNTYVNKHFVEYSGLSAEQTAGVGWKAAIHPDDIERHAGKWIEAVATGKPHENEVRFRRSDGQYRWHLDRGVPLRDEAGNVVKWYGVVTDIEDRKRAEEVLGELSRDLQESKTRLEEAQRITHVGYWERDLVTGCIIWSDETYRIFGLRPQEGPIDLATLRQKTHPEDWKLVSQALDEALGGGARYNLEYRVLRPTGELRIVHSTGDVKKDASGRPYQMFGTVQDITDRKRAEEALQRSQFYINEGQRLAHMGSWAFNPAGFFDYWSEELFDIYGLDPQRGAPTLEQYLATLHPHDRDFMADTIKRMIAEHSGCDVRKRIICPDGELRYVRCVGIPVVQGEVLKGFLGTAMDITEQELLTRELERRQAHLSEAQKLTHTGSWAWRLADQSAAHLSEEWYSIFGFDPAEGAPAWELYLERIHPEDRLKCKNAIERAIAEKADYEREFRILLPNGMVKWIHTVSHPVLSDAGELEQFVGSSTDVTERKSAEQEHEKLRQLEAELAHINRVSMLGEMAASLAHEIKQPIAAAITSANTCVEWLAHEPPNLDRARAAAARIDKYGNRAAEIIDRIRSFYKKSSPRRELVEVNGIVDEMLTLLKGEAYRLSVTMRTDLAAELPEIMVDRVQLQQVLMNLMLNAIEAMASSGGELAVKSELRDSLIQFSVSDTGLGLPIGSVDQIFSAFFTTKPQGSGMGLAISRSIVESHGGQLWASANGGGGATFHFTLPIQATESSPLVA
jgi:PAS domain S-box-containing protein